MKKMKKYLQNEKIFFIKGIFLFNILVILFSITDFLALHDIAKDYLSREALMVAEIVTSVPAWTATKGEWLILQVSFGMRIIFLLLNILLIYSLIKRSPTKK